MSRLALSPVLAGLALGAASLAPILGARVALPVGEVASSPTGVPGVQVSVEADRAAVLADGDRRVGVRLELAADTLADTLAGEGTEVPTDLVIVLDRSGSMGGDKILDAKAAALELVGQLGPDDRLAVVSFSSDVRVDIPLGAGTPEERRARIEALVASGGTAMHLGLDAGLGLLAEPTRGRARRLALISDGMPDTVEGLDLLATRAATNESPLTTIGIGVDYDEALMQRLADAGTGNFHWVQRGPQLAAVLADELDTARETVASGVLVQLDSESGARIVDAAGYPVVEGTLALGSLFSGQRRSLWVTVELPPGMDVGDVEPGSFDVRWAGPTGQLATASVALPTVEVTRDRDRFVAAVDAEAWSSCTVQEDYNALRSRVSAAVQRGDAGEAQRAIDDYRDEKAAMNAFVGSAQVADNLREVDALAAEVQVQAANPRELQNAWSKGLSAEAYQGRRAGQSKSW